MADNPLQLPSLPTAPRPLGVNQNAAAPVAPGGIAAVGKFLTQPFTTPPAPVAPVPTAPLAATPSLPNPYAPGGVIPPVASPAAVQAFSESLSGGRQGGNAPLSAAQPAATAAKDPQAGQIRFIDQNSPKVAAPAAPNVIRGGVGGPSGITNRDVAAIAPLVPSMRSASERAQHSLMDFFDAEHQADIEAQAAAVSGDPTALAAAQQKQSFFKRPESRAYLGNLKQFGLPILPQN